MSMEVRIDASEFDSLSRAMKRIPGEIKAKAMARAMTRMRSMARTRIVKRNAEHTELPQREIRKRTTAAFNAGGTTQDIIVKSGWIPLYKLGATQTSKGVRVRGRGSYKSAFLAQMKSSHAGVFVNTGGFNNESKRNNAIRELFGPNPAHAITNNPDVYLQVMAELLEEYLAPRVLHEVERLLHR